MKTKDDPKEVKKEIKKQGHENQNIYDFNPSQFEEEEGIDKKKGDDQKVDSKKKRESK